MQINLFLVPAVFSQLRGVHLTMQDYSIDFTGNSVRLDINLNFLYVNNDYYTRLSSFCIVLITDRDM